jgi:hypothetical protein
MMGFRTLVVRDPGLVLTGASTPEAALVCAASLGCSGGPLRRWCQRVGEGMLCGIADDENKRGGSPVPLLAFSARASL